MKTANTTPPNLFQYATKELSQDAFIAWLLAWADAKHKETDQALNKCSKNLIFALLDTQGIKLCPKEIKSVEVHIQKKNIDVICVVNKTYAIVIEDKVRGTDNTKKLAKYISNFRQSPEFQHIKKADICPIYFKTYNESCLKYVEAAGFKAFLRPSFLKILRNCGSENSIFCDFKNHLEKIEENINSYKTKQLHDWDNDAWVGFFGTLQKQLKTGNWGYASNASGGHLVFWWGGIQVKGGEIYFQIEPNYPATRMRVRISVLNSNIPPDTPRTEYRRNLRNIHYENFLKVFNDAGFPMEKPSRFGNGGTMVILLAKYGFLVFDNNIINISKTIANIQKISIVLSDQNKFPIY